MVLTPWSTTTNVSVSASNPTANFRIFPRQSPSPTCNPPRSKTSSDTNSTETNSTALPMEVGQLHHLHLRSRTQDLPQYRFQEINTGSDSQRNGPSKALFNRVITSQQV